MFFDVTGIVQRNARVSAYKLMTTSQQAVQDNTHSQEPVPTLHCQVLSILLMYSADFV